MQLPKQIHLFYVPGRIAVEAEVVELTEAVIAQRMGEAWWDHPELDPNLCAREIDRHWDWASLQIDRDEQGVLPSRKLALVTGDEAVQGAAMFSIEPVGCASEVGQNALFVELLFTAPWNRHWIRKDRTEQFRGIGLELLIAMAEESRDMGFAGRLKLDSSPGFVNWYAKRGLQVISEDPIVYEGVAYTPMELTADAAAILLSGS